MRIGIRFVALAICLGACQQPEHQADPARTPASEASAEAPQDRTQESTLLQGRAFEAVIWGVPAVNYMLMRQEMALRAD